MDEEIKSRVDLLEQRLKLYKKLIDNHNGSIDALERRMDNCFRLYEINRKIQDEKYQPMRSLLDTITQKLHDVYYHIYPARALQDLKFMDQLDALKSKTPPDAKPSDT